MRQHKTQFDNDLVEALAPNALAEVSEGWVPTTADDADWAALKAAQAEARYQEALAAANRQRQKIDAWLANAKTQRDDEVSKFEGYAVQYLLRVRADEAAKGTREDKLTKTLKLLSGAQVQIRQQPDKVTVTDEAAAMEWAETAGEQYYRVKKSLALNEIKKHIKNSGELPVGIELESGDVKVTLKLPEETA